MKELNIYMCGVGGQGIGLLSEVLVQTCLKAGYKVKSVDTHGLAQRGGTVVSHLRIGENVYSPLIPPKQADIVIALERLEALRAASDMLKKKGKVIYYNATYQPIDVRLENFKYPTERDLENFSNKIEAELLMVDVESLPDPRMQNIALIATILKNNWLDKINKNMVLSIMEDLLPKNVFEANKKVLKEVYNLED